MFLLLLLDVGVSCKRNKYYLYVNMISTLDFLFLSFLQLSNFAPGPTCPVIHHISQNTLDSVLCVYCFTLCLLVQTSGFMCCFTCVFSVGFFKLLHSRAVKMIDNLCLAKFTLSAEWQKACFFKASFACKSYSSLNS